MKYLLILLLLFSTHFLNAENETITVEDVKNHISAFLGSGNIDNKYFPEPLEVYCVYEKLKYDERYFSKELICEHYGCEEKLIIFEERHKIREGRGKEIRVRVNANNAPISISHRIYTATVTKELISLWSYYQWLSGARSGNPGSYELNISRVTGKVHKKLTRYIDSFECNSSENNKKTETYGWVIPSSVPKECRLPEIDLYGTCDKNIKQKF